MSRRALSFFNSWIAGHAGPEDAGQAMTKVSDLLLDAVVKGIPSSEFEEEFPALDHEFRLAVKRPEGARSTAGSAGAGDHTGA